MKLVLIMLYTFLILWLTSHMAHASGVAPGSPVSSANTNAAFLARNGDTSGIGRVALLNTDPGSGTSTTNIQQYLNGISHFIGGTSNPLITSLPTWSSNLVGTSTDNLVARSTALTLAFDRNTGHNHNPSLTNQGGVIDFSYLSGQVDLTSQVKNVLPIANGGSGQSSFSSGALISNGTSVTAGVVSILNGGTGQTTANAALNALLPSQAGAAGFVLKTNGTNTGFLAEAVQSVFGRTGVITAQTGDYSFSQISGTATTSQLPAVPTGQLSGQISLTTQVSGALPIANGGTNNGSLAVTNGGVLYTDGSKVTNAGTGTSGFVLTTQGSGAAPVWAAASSSGTVSSVAAGAGLTTGSASPITTSGSISLVAPVSVTNGGTGQTNAYNSFGVAYAASGGLSITSSGVGTSGQVLTSNGAGLAPSMTSLSAPTTSLGFSNSHTFQNSNLYYTFTVSAGTWAAGDQYTNNGSTFGTLYSSGTSTTTFVSTATGVPLGSGTLTRTSGSGSATLTFSASSATSVYFVPTNPSPKYIVVTASGGGGGGGGSGITGAAGGTGGTGATASFGASLLTTAGFGGTGGATYFIGAAGFGGGATLNGTLFGYGRTGTAGGNGLFATILTVDLAGGPGGTGGCGDGGARGGTNIAGSNADYGGGGGGAGIVAVANQSTGGGGGGGGCGTGYYTGSNLIGFYPITFSVQGTSGAAGGTAGTSGLAGGRGGLSYITVIEYY